jgi:hypothetical protein
MRFHQFRHAIAAYDLSGPERTAAAFLNRVQTPDGAASHTWHHTPGVEGEILDFGLTEALSMRRSSMTLTTSTPFSDVGLRAMA